MIMDGWQPIMTSYGTALDEGDEAFMFTDKDNPA